MPLIRSQSDRNMATERVFASRRWGADTLDRWIGAGRPGAGRGPSRADLRWVVMGLYPFGDPVTRVLRTAK